MDDPQQTIGWMVTRQNRAQDSIFRKQYLLTGTPPPPNIFCMGEKKKKREGCGERERENKIFKVWLYFILPTLSAMAPYYSKNTFQNLFRMTACRQRYRPVILVQIADC